MVICIAQGVTYEQLANELNKQGYWESVTGFQCVDFNRRFAIVIENASVRDKLVERGLNIEGKHIIFGYHKRRANTRVYVSQRVFTYWLSKLTFSSVHSSAIAHIAAYLLEKHYIELFLGNDSCWSCLNKGTMLDFFSRSPSARASTP